MEIVKISFLQTHRSKTRNLLVLGQRPLLKYFHGKLRKPGQEGGLAAKPVNILSEIRDSVEGASDVEFIPTEMNAINAAKALYKQMVVYVIHCKQKGVLCHSSVFLRNYVSS